MEDVSEFFKSNFLGLYKNQIGKNYQQKTLKDRVNNFKIMRRETRNSLIFKKRQINDNMTPTNTPEPCNVKQIAEIKDVKKPNKRLEMLHKWKIEKEKRKQEEKQKAKPLFKVCHVPVEVGLPNLKNVNKNIKGKPIRANTSRSQSQFAPPNHSFHAPKAIKPIHMNPVNTVPPVKSKVDLFKTNNLSNSLEKSKLFSRVTHKEVIPQRTTRAASRNRQHDKFMESENKNHTNHSKMDINKRIKPINSKPKTEGRHINSKTKETTLHDKVELKSMLNSKVKQSPGKKSKKDLSSVSSTGIDNKNANNFLAKNCESNKGKRLTNRKKISNRNNDADKFSSEVEVFQKNHSVGEKLTKSSEKNIRKIVAWNHVEVVGGDGFSADIKTPKTIQRKYKKTPGKGHKLDISDPEETDEGNINVKRSNSQNIPKNDKKVKGQLRKNKSNGEIKDFDQLKQIECDTNSHDSTIGSASGSVSPDYPIEKNLTEVNNSFHTPQKNNVREDSPVYVSPFVTVSRGKTSARKEYLIRHSSGSLTPEFDVNVLNNTSPKAGADYFLKKLNDEINRIESVCDIWDIYKNSNELPEEANDMINVAIGQSKLLISKKFQQFRNLIDECRKCEYVEKPISCEDLHGFWDMIYMQVGDLNKRFNNLDVLKSNNWQEIIPEKKVIVKRGRGRPKKAAASTALKNLIKTARDMKKSGSKDENNLNVPQVDEVKVFNGGYYSVNSPIKVVNEPQVMKGSGRRSLRVSLLTNQAKNRLSSSPGLTIMKITQAIKHGDGVTPGKSILKNDLTRSEKRITKSVLFKDDDNLEEDIEAKFISATKESNGDQDLDKENDINEINLITFSPVTPTRRSKRLSKLK